MPDWDDLRVFLEVARAQSLSGAGRRLRLDPATVGRRIARLERALGQRLFLRGPQGYSLVDAGARLIEAAQAMELAMLTGQSAIGDAASGLSGSVRLGAPDGCANFLLPQVVAGLCAENPGLEVQIVALPRVFNLTRREADLAIAVSPPDQARVTVQKIADYRLHLAASATYLAKAPPVTRATLHRHRIIGYIPDLIFDRELDYLGELGLAAPHLASNSVAVQLQLIRAGAGLGVVHDFALPAVSGVRRVLVQGFSLTRSFWLVRHVDDRQTARLEGFTAALLAGLRAELAALERRAAQPEGETIPDRTLDNAPPQGGP